PDGITGRRQLSARAVGKAIRGTHRMARSGPKTPSSRGQSAAVSAQLRKSLPGLFRAGRCWGWTVLDCTAGPRLAWFKGRSQTREAPAPDGAVDRFPPGPSETNPGNETALRKRWRLEGLRNDRFRTIEWH